MLLDSAILIADDVFSALYPHCERIAIAGSIRRRKPDVKDIEIVCIPKGSIQIKGKNRGKAQKVFVPCMGYIETVSQWHKVRGEAWDKSTQRFLSGEGAYGPWNINVDIFTAHKDNWGYIMAIRTGSADYSHHVLAAGWVKKGYHGEGGMLYKGAGTENPVPVREEEEIFNIIGIPFTNPQDREYKL